MLTSLNKLLLIIAMIACYAMIFIDESGIAVTLPTMQQSLALSNNMVQWVLNSYLLVLSVLLLLGGKLADIYGRRKIFAIGVIIFLLASLICAFAQNTVMLISGRLLQGVGASLLMPCITVIIHRGFSESEFGKAFGLILGFSNLFYALGPFVGGVLTEFASWRWFFGVNIPIGLICLLFTFLAVPSEAKDENMQFTDIKGLLTFIFSLSALVFAIMQGSVWGWGDPWIIGLFVFSMLSLLAFIKIELNAKTPLFDMRLFNIKAFFAGNITLFCASITLTATVFWALWLQLSMELSPATVGIALLPATLTFIFVPTLGGAWIDKVGTRAPMLTGCGLILSGMIWITLTMNLHSYSWLFFGLVLFGVGIPLAIPGSVMTIMQSVSPEHSGMASGMFTTVRQLGLSIGIAILGAIVTASNTKYLTDLLHSSSDYANVTMHQVNMLLAGKDTIELLSQEKIMQLKQAASFIYTHALVNGMVVMVLVALIACVVTYLFIEKKSVQTI